MMGPDKQELCPKCGCVMLDPSFFDNKREHKICCNPYCEPDNLDLSPVDMPDREDKLRGEVMQLEEGIRIVKQRCAKLESIILAMLKGELSPEMDTEVRVIEAKYKK